MKSAHPSAESLAAYCRGTLSDKDSTVVELHLASCDACIEAVEGMGEGTELLERLRGQTEPMLEKDPALAVWMKELQEQNPLATLVSEHEILSLLTPSESPGEMGKLGRYRILGELGAGAMGCVFRAMHPVMERVVALKVMSRKLLGDPAAVARFHREVKAISRLHHPNIVAAHDADVAGDLHFLVMEYVDGIDLARLAQRRGPLPYTLAANYIRQAALGLQHAHELGMIHRDIKPGNLLLTRDGHIKLLDLGLARMVHESSGSQETKAGTVMGTPDFMAPEQAADSHSADIRADIYSLGCTLYKLLSGQAPFPGGGAVDKLLAHQLRQPRQLSSLRSDLPPSLVAVVEKMMAKRPADRYQTPAAAAAALAPFAQAEAEALDTETDDWQAAPAEAKPAPVSPSKDTLADLDPTQANAKSTVRLPTPSVAIPPTPPAPVAKSAMWQQRNNTPLIAVGFLLFAVALFGVATFTLRTPHGTLVVKVLEPDVEVLVDGTEKVTIQSNKAGTIQLIPGPHKLTVKRGDEELFTDNFELKRGGEVLITATWEKKTASAEGQKRTAPDKADGERVKEGSPTIQRVPSDAAPLEPISRIAMVGEPAPIQGLRSWTFETASHRAYVKALAYSPDGHLLASAGRDGSIRIWEAESLKLVGVMLAHSDNVNSLAWSRVNGRIASSSEDRTVRVWDPRSRQLEHTIAANSKRNGTAWSPDGERLAVGSDHAVQLYASTTWQVLKTLPHKGVAALAWSSDGKSLATGDHVGTIKIWNPATGELIRTMEGHTAEVFKVQYLPASARLISASWDHTVRLWDTATGQVGHTFKDGSSRIESACMSPDGRFLAAADKDISLWDLESKNLVRRLTSEAVDSAFSLAFSPDCRRLMSGRFSGAINCWDSNSGNLYRSVLGMTGVTNAMSWSRLGSELAFTDSFDGASKLHLWSIEAAKPRSELTALPCPATSNVISWSPKRNLVAVGHWNGLISLVSPATGACLQTLKGHERGLRALAWSHDGSKLASGGQDRTVRIWNVESGVVLHKSEGYARPVWSLEWSPDSAQLAAASIADSVRILDASSGKEVKTFNNVAAGGALSWSADGEHLASGAFQDGWLQIWDVKSGNSITKVQLHNAGIFNLVWNPDGETVTSVSSDGYVCTVTARTGQLVAKVPGWGGNGGAMSPDKRLIASVGEFGSKGGGVSMNALRVWRSNTGQLVTTVVVLRHDSELIISPSGHFRGTPGVERELVYIAQTDQGQTMYSPEEFAKKFGWKNDPERVRLTEK